MRHDAKVKSNKHADALQNPRLKIKLNACPKWKELEYPKVPTSECNKCSPINDQNNTR